MYCRGCGKEINDQAVICVHCGQATGVGTNTSGNGGGLAEYIVPGWLIAVCILIPIVGIIIGIIKCSSGAESSGKKCIKYSVVTICICSLISFVYYLCVAGAMGMY